MLTAFPSGYAKPLAGSAVRDVRLVELIEDDPSMQRALSMALRGHGFVVDLYGSRQDYMAARRPAGPRVLLLDMRLPDGTGLEIRDWLVQQQDEVPVIFISGQSAPQEIIDALKGGAQDFLLKPVRLAQLLESVERAFDQYHTSRSQADVAGRLRRHWSDLTRREREVCVLMLNGLANREIARLHGSVPGTVKVHRARVLEKMGAQSLSDLFKLTAGHGLAAWLQDEQDGKDGKDDRPGGGGQ